MNLAGGVAVTGPGQAGQTLVHVSLTERAMGGRLGVHLAVPEAEGLAAERLALQVAHRVRSWARRLSRFEPDSQLTLLNQDRRTLVPVPPTIAEALEWAGEAAWLTGGIVDVTLLDERLAEATARDDAKPPDAVSDAVPDAPAPRIQLARGTALRHVGGSRTWDTGSRGGHAALDHASAAPRGPVSTSTVWPRAGSRTGPLASSGVRPAPRRRRRRPLHPGCPG